MGGALNVLTGYIVKEILKASLVAALIFLTLFNLFTFADELGDIGKGSYGLKDIFLFLVLKSPGVFYQLVPSAALIGSLFVLGTMANNSEIVAMRVSGLSVLGIVKAALLAGLVLILFSISIGEFIAPTAERTAQLIRSTAQKKKLIMHSYLGFWLRDENTFINVRRIPDEGQLADISMYELNDQRRLRKITRAKEADFVDNKKWMLKHIRQTEITGDQLVANEINKQIWNSAIDPNFLDVVMVKPENLSLYDLAKYIEFLQDNGQKSQSFELAFWSRLINPLTTLAMLLIAVPFVIKAHRNMSIGKRILVGVIFGMGFYIVDKIIGHVGLVYEVNPMLMGVLPSLMIFAIALTAISTIR